MINELLKNLLRYFFLVLLQVLIIKNIELGGYINPFVYVLFIILLPFNTPDWLLLIVSFLTGLSIDVFYDTLGVHAASCVFMAYARKGVLKLFSPREGYEIGAQPTIVYLGIPWFLSYSSILILLHHFALFYLEIFRFDEFFSTLLRIFLSSFATLILIIILQYLVPSKNTIE